MKVVKQRSRMNQKWVPMQLLSGNQTQQARVREQAPISSESRYQMRTASMNNSQNKLKIAA